MRSFQLTSETRLALGDPRECEEAILKVTRQEGTVLQVLDRLSLSVQHSFDAFDEFVAVGQEELEQFDMCLKRPVVDAKNAA